MNEKIFNLFYGLAHQSAAFDTTMIFLADTLPYLVIAGAGFFLLFHHEVFQAESPMEVFLQKYKEIGLVFFSGALAWILAHVFKFLLRYPRPIDSITEVVTLFEKTDYGFPSGHAAFFMALAFSIYFVHKKAGFVFMCLALLISLSRVTAGVHYPVDILGGFILGALVAYLVRKI